MSIIINLSILDRAVDEKIRPILIDQGKLLDLKAEGYHHAKIIPEVKPFLTHESLKADSYKAAYSAIALRSHNLLASNEKIQANQFLKDQKKSEILKQFNSLLFSSENLKKRITSFLTWSKYQRDKNGKQFGMNGTIVSFLLSMSNPNRYAFCKPTVYKESA